MNMQPEETGTRGKGTPHKIYTEEFKRSVVDHWCHSDKTAAQVAQEFGVKVWNVRDWRRQFGPTPKPLDAPLPATTAEMAREIQQLRKELARVTTQRDILKKTMGILSEG
jgi:transposase